MGLPVSNASAEVNARWSCGLACLTAATAALWLALGDLQRLNHADSLIPTFASLHRWTWFYWGQNRFGMLTALLAMPIHHPLANLLFQNWIVSFCGLLVFPLVHAHLLGWRTAPISGALGAAVFLLASPECFHLDYLLANQPYAVSGCLGLLGLLAMEPESDNRQRIVIRRLVAGLLLFLAFWVNLAGVFIIAPLFILKLFFGGTPVDRRRKILSSGSTVILATALANWVITVGYPYHEDYGWTPPSAWLQNSTALLHNVYQVISPAFLICLLALACIGTAARLFGGNQGKNHQYFRAGLILVLSALFYLMLAAASAHVRQGEFPYRYAIPSLVLLVAAATIFASQAGARLSPRWRGSLVAALMLGLMTGVTLRYGPPSFTHVRLLIDQKFGANTKVLRNNHCTHVLGDYWDVWETVFHANLVNYESGSQQVIWGITARSQVTKDLWFPLLKGGRLAVLQTSKSDRDWQQEALTYQLPELKPVAESNQIRVFSPVE